VRVCLVSQQYPPETAAGGIGAHTLTKAERLVELGHSVHVLTTTWRPGPDLRSDDVDGIVVHRMRPPAVFADITETAPYWLGQSWLVFAHLRALEQRFAFDLINFAEFGSEGYVYQLDRDPRDSPTVAVHMHGPLMLLAERIGWPEEGSELHRVGGHMEAETIRLADGLLSSSAATADFAAAHYGVDRGAIDVVHCGVDLDVFSPVPAAGSGREIRRVLFVGNVSPQKGIVTAFEAVMRLRARYPTLVLTVVGRDHLSLGRRLLRRAEEAGAADALELVGHVADRQTLAAYYREADVLCGPGKFECGPVIVNVEAMACGCPVVTGDSPGAAEAVVQGETGFLVPGGDLEATVSALDRVLGDAQLRARLGEQARRHVEGYFGEEQYIARVLAAYERTRERSLRPPRAADRDRR
jgi:glycosyltransferase involved in cell wall biosynthesis